MIHPAPGARDWRRDQHLEGDHAGCGYGKPTAALRHLRARKIRTRQRTPVSYSRLSFLRLQPRRALRPLRPVKLRRRWLSSQRSARTSLLVGTRTSTSTGGASCSGWALPSPSKVCISSCDARLEERTLRDLTFFTPALVSPRPAPRPPPPPPRGRTHQHVPAHREIVPGPAPVCRRGDHCPLGAF